jgi:ribonuclease P protein component
VTLRKKFPKAARLLKRESFIQMQKGSLRSQGNWMTLHYRKGDFPSTRLGITVSKKFGKAHDRNRFKRRVREAIRHLYSEILPGFNINITPQLPPKELSYQEALFELKELLLKTKLCLPTSTTNKEKPSLPLPVESSS